ncbi:hypothetical protein Aca07nite_07630 [Actinoplanes capillaceus]|uniref:Uncharacterized protein n=1 Tax=Actinoplanes campanulatus TaxID=113559 RepID=A0ABQ3WF69_9ACTN|nr:hypothetical protein Aca07nite_07630 [Actinoplanes capillaceus]
MREDPQIRPPGDGTGHRLHIEVIEMLMGDEHRVRAVQYRRFGEFARIDDENSGAFDP